MHASQTGRFRRGAPNRKFLLLISLAVLAGLSACTGLETNLQDTEVSYESTARRNFESGEKAFTDERYNEAIKFFEHVKNQFPYSKYAVLAELRIADAHFEREKWLEAADTYRLFVRFHPRHEQVSHAIWRIAVSYNEEMKKGFFLLPASHETDLSATEDAIRAFDDYLRRYPAGEHHEEARELRTQARTRLAEHDMYAAGFYLQREKWQGALWRYEHVAAAFADTPRAPTALLAAGQICAEQLARPEDGRTYLNRLLEQYPDAPEVEAAKELLSELVGSAGGAERTSEAN